MASPSLGWARTVAIGAVATALLMSAPSSAITDQGNRSGDHSARLKALTIEGRGYGHGIGMSQYGAQGAARQGVHYRKILRHYYPNTRLNELHGFIRVHLTADTTDPLVVRAAPGLKVRDLQDGKAFRLPSRDRIRSWRLIAAPHKSARSVVQYRTPDGWRRWQVPGRTLLRGVGAFRRPGTLRLVLPGGDIRRYRGALRAAKPTPGSGRRDTVNALRVQHYLKGVVPDEVPASWSKSALRAQAVAARTYALYLKTQHTQSHYDLCDTTACQVYNGYDAEEQSTNAAVRATSGVTVTYQGDPALTMFSSSSGGWTASGGLPYLRAHRDRYDRWSGNPMRDWKVRVRASVVRQAYPSIGRLTGASVAKRNGHGAWGGRVTQVRLTGTRDAVRVSGAELRSVLGLRSDWFRFLG